MSFVVARERSVLAIGSVVGPRGEWVLPRGDSVGALDVVVGARAD